MTGTGGWPVRKSGLHLFTVLAPMPRVGFDPEEWVKDFSVEETYAYFVIPVISQDRGDHFWFVALVVGEWESIRRNFYSRASQYRIDVSDLASVDEARHFISQVTVGGAPVLNEDLKVVREDVKARKDGFAAYLSLTDETNLEYWYETDKGSPELHELTAKFFNLTTPKPM